MRPLRSIFLISLAAALAGAAAGQKVFWEPSGGELQEGKANRLELHFEGCSPGGEPALPDTPGLDMQRLGTSNSTQIIGGSVSKKVIKSYQAIPRRRGRIVIPAFTVQTDAGPVDVGRAVFEVAEATVGNSGAKASQILHAELETDAAPIYPGQIFGLTYRVGIKENYQATDLTTPNWSPSGLVSAGFDDYRQVRFQNANGRYVGLEFDVEAMALEAGRLELPEVSQNVAIVVGRRRSFVFDDPVVERFAIRSNKLVLDVEPLPPGAPESFAGAVGAFSLDAAVAPRKVRVGEPITWTLTLEGRGNWPAGIGLPSRQASASFRTIQPRRQNQFEKDALFEGSQTEDIVLIPTEPGSYRLGPTAFAYFDPEEKRYVTAEAPAYTIEVEPLPAAAQAPPPVGGESPSPGGPRRDPPAPQGLNLLDKPIELPEGPAEGSLAAPAPKGRVPLRTGLAWTFGPPAALWLSLALAMALRRDPTRSARRARATLADLARARPLPADEAGLERLQRQWRDATRRCLGIEPAEPTPEEVRAGALRLADEATADAWERLWRLSDRMLFGLSRRSFDEAGRPERQWLEEWQDALRQALDRTAKPRRSLKALLEPPTWGFAALALAAGLFAAPSPGRSAPPAEEGGESPSALYRQGRLEEAEAAWEAAARARPDDAAPAYNLGLVAAQREQWGLALAHWTSALVQRPREERLRWNLSLALSKTGAYLPAVDRLARPAGHWRVVALLSPREWERFARRAAQAAGLLLALAVLCRYAPRARRLGKWLALLGLVAALGLPLAWWAHRQYGWLASPDTRLVVAPAELRSIPTDLEIEQLTTQAPEGSAGRLLASFLGWRRIELPNGETGWLRSELLRPLYPQATGSS